MIHKSHTRRKVAGSASAGVGRPVADTVNVPAFPAANVTLAAVVIVGAWLAGLTFSVKFWLAAVPTPLAAVIVRS